MANLLLGTSMADENWQKEFIDFRFKHIKAQFNGITDILNKVDFTWSDFVADKYQITKLINSVDADVRSITSTIQPS